MTPTPLQVRDFPLHGSRLIEASAGTGKTWTIAMLYVRLVLGPRPGDDPAAFARPLTPPEVLVVTFTEAATQELRARVRLRLAQAARVFRDDPAERATLRDDPDLQALLALRADHPEADWPRLAVRLQVAAEWMDEAAVSTIHGWCLRMLREHAFDGNSLFQQTLETDPAELQAEVARDAWRSFYAPLPAALAQEVLRWWNGPDALLRAVRPLLELAATGGLDPADPRPPDELLATAQAQRDAALAALKAPWPAWTAELKTLFDAGAAAKHFNAKQFRAQYYDTWLDKLRAWATDPQALAAPDLLTGWQRLTPEGLTGVCKDPAHAAPGAQHPALAALADLRAHLAQLPCARADLLRHAAHWMHQRFQREQAARAQMGFNDLLLRLDQALHGPNGERLAATIRRQFPVALIDEFQDTDPLQYRIFDRVYRVAQPEPDTALVLIGDPKQAIYAFRGADIHTYLRARQACADRLYTLGTNFRSTAAMVEAVNHCFASAEARPEGAGAFGFRSPGRDNPVPFTPAQAAGRAQQWYPQGLAGGPGPALTLCHLPLPAGGQALGKDAALQQLAQVCASAMVGWLHGGQAGFGAPAAGETAGEAAATWRPLRPADMAVLVHTRKEADAIRAALAERGLRSVYLSDRESVYATPTAQDLQHWLHACADPDDPRPLRAALATATLGQSWAQLDAWRQDELAWETVVLRFRGYRDTWRQRGVLPMVRELLHDFDVPARLLDPQAPPGGERTLTDLLHLAELLQHASAALEGEHALIRHLAEQRQLAAQGRGGDAPQVRLESDAELVQVVTVHKSKGLEYPLVCYPFACLHRPVQPSDTPLRWHDDAGQLQLTLDGDPDTLAATAERADAERLGEDLRKLYVALTRARYATWVGLAPLADLHRSAFGCLMGGGAPLDLPNWPAPLVDWASPADHTEALPAPEPSTQRWNDPHPPATASVTRTCAPVAPQRWWVASYSALRLADTAGAATDAGPAAPSAPDTPQHDQVQEMAAAPPDTPPPGAETAADGPRARPAPLSPHAFPRGAEAGTFLHDLLEWCAQQGFAAVVQQPARLRDQVARRCQARGWSGWVDTVTDWLLACLQA
ncbi:exodeoxyribonuclease V subunit beta, partial [Aquabacterium sp. A08]|uniref:exodeoxyribonuclease V subunit beta n=1 Tax=Aquabacterium sp. A08 TaxID=2718532 RepID=UPI00141E45B9